jgi:hypothetical protein
VDIVLFSVFSVINSRSNYKNLAFLLISIN